MGPTSTAFLGDYETKSEDRRYLNAWTLAKTSSDRLPVLLWIHGGGFRVGSGTERLHHGDHLAVADTIPYDLAVVSGTQAGEPLPADRWASCSRPWWCWWAAGVNHSFTPRRSRLREFYRTRDTGLSRAATIPPC